MNKILFDTIIITVSSRYQKDILVEHIEEKKKNNQISKNANFIIIEERVRIGSGGAIFNIIKSFDENFFKKSKILLINSAGESKRLPEYAEKGKIFIPIENQSNILFDEILMQTNDMAKHIDNGLLVVTGDCLIKYKKIPDGKWNDNTLITVNAPVEVGQRHGVFIVKEKFLMGFLHKKSKKELQENNAVDENGNIKIDTGMVYFNENTIDILRQIITTNGIIDEEKYKKVVNENIKLNLYSDIIYVLANNGNLEEYLNQKPELEMNEEIIIARKEIWRKLRESHAKVLELEDGEFIHLGTTEELKKFY